jgi:hypothetical protein
MTLSQFCEGIAQGLREFGYSHTTADMIRNTHNAMKAGEPIPYGIVGMFARGQLEKAGDALNRLNP